MVCGTYEYVYDETYDKNYNWNSFDDDLNNRDDSLNSVFFSDCLDRQFKDTYREKAP